MLWALAIINCCDLWPELTSLDLSYVVGFDHNKLLWPLARISLSVTSQMLWVLAIINCCDLWPELAFCDLSNVVGFGYNKLLWPLARISLSVTSQTLWHLAKANYGDRCPAPVSFVRAKPCPLFGNSRCGRDSNSRCGSCSKIKVICAALIVSERFWSIHWILFLNVE